MISWLSNPLLMFCSKAYLSLYRVWGRNCSFMSCRRRVVSNWGLLLSRGCVSLMDEYWIRCKMWLFWAFGIEDGVAIVVLIFAHKEQKRQKVDEGKPTRLEGLNMARSAGNPHFAPFYLFFLVSVAVSFSHSFSAFPLPPSLTHHQYLLCRWCTVQCKAWRFA